MSGAGKGPRIKGVNTKALRTGYEGINWAKKPRPVCCLCHRPISEDDLDSLRAGYAKPSGSTHLVPYHFACFDPS